MALFLTFLVGLFIVLGVFIGYYQKHNDKFISLSIGLAFGVIVSLIILEMIPETYELLDENIKFNPIISIIILSVLGIAVLKILDILIPHHEHIDNNHHEHNCEVKHLNHIGIMASVALILHNLIEGMTLYITTNQSLDTGVLLCLGIGLHNLPMGIMLATTLDDKKEIIITTFCVSISTLLGGIIMLAISGVISDLIVGILIAITTGMLIYISILELLPQIISSKEKKYNIIGIIFGILILSISVILG